MRLSILLMSLLILQSCSKKGSVDILLAPKDQSKNLPVDTPKAPILSWNKTSHDFGQESVGIKTSGVLFKLTNSGETKASGCSAPELSSQADFLIESDFCATSDLEVGASCEITLKGRPGNLGLRMVTLSRNCTTGGVASSLENQIKVTGTSKLYFDAFENFRPTQTCIGPFILVSRGESATPAPLSQLTTIALETNALGEGAFYSDPDCSGSTTTSTTIKAQSAVSLPVYYKNDTAQSFVISSSISGTSLVQAGSIEVTLNPRSSNTWAANTSLGSPGPRSNHSAIWTEIEMIIWGGMNSNNLFLNSGHRYNPTTDTWGQPLSIVGAPEGRSDHTAVWTGTEMIIWGGYNCQCNTGYRYDPVKDEWTGQTSTDGAPTGRFDHSAVWTGTEMIVWGGSLGSENAGRYNPSTDKWILISNQNAPVQRRSHSAVWTGTEMMVWGGLKGWSETHKDGAFYNPSTDTWRTLNTAPSGRASHSAIWTGSKVIIWGGWNENGLLNTGLSYNPSDDSWTAINQAESPSARNGHSAIWTGTEMIVWGGWSEGNVTNTGKRYNPNTDSWGQQTNNSNSAPEKREKHTAVWTGSEMIIWGGMQVEISTQVQATIHILILGKPHFPSLMLQLPEAVILQFGVVVR